VFINETFVIFFFQINKNIYRTITEKNGSKILKSVTDIKYCGIKNPEEHYCFSKYADKMPMFLVFGTNDFVCQKKIRDKEE